MLEITNDFAGKIEKLVFSDNQQLFYYNVQSMERFFAEKSTSY